MCKDKPPLKAWTRDTLLANAHRDPAKATVGIIASPAPANATGVNSVQGQARGTATIQCISFAADISAFFQLG
jgi:hypothetical protein